MMFLFNLANIVLLGNPGIMIPGLLFLSILYSHSKSENDLDTS